MLKVRVIPTMLWKGPGLVKGVGFNSWRRTGPVLPAIKVYNRRDVDELVLVNIDATINGDAPDFDTLVSYSEECFVPFTVGGGINTVDQIRQLLRCGADKVIINSAAYHHPELINAAATLFGAQCVVASIDARVSANGKYRCVSASGTCDMPHDPVEWARHMESEGAGEILITSIDRDGTMQGYDLELIESITTAVNLPVIASGGAGSYEHMREAVQEAGASAVAAASMFHFTEQTPAEAKRELKACGIAMREQFREA